MKQEKIYKKERKDVARFMKRLYWQGLTTTSGGNISLRVSEDIILITPSATDKGRMKWNEVGIMSILGENLTPELKPSIEHELHLLIYRKNSECTAVIHAHPLFATTFTAMNGTINTNLTAEARAICGEPRFVSYALMGSSELAEIVAQNCVESDILLLENHGILTTGTSLLQAFDKLEVLENAAKMTLLVELNGKKRALSSFRIREIDRLFR
jgi:L-fuculose-phosphate aldolase